MGAKGRRRLHRKKAKNRTGLIKSLTGPYSANQHDKRVIHANALLVEQEHMMRKLGLL